MPERRLPIAQILTLLAENPRRITEATEGWAPAQLHTAPTSDGWSANDVLAHVRACADVWGECIVTMIAEDRPTLRAINPRSWIKQTDYRELGFQPSFGSFTAQRAELLAVLAALTRRPAAISWRHATLHDAIAAMSVCCAAAGSTAAPPPTVGATKIG